jgi:DNA modification methylase
VSWQVLHADCIEAMREMAEASVDAIVTDPPYGLEFMAKEWDRFQSSGEAWSRKDTRSPDWNGREVHRQATAYPRSTKKRCRACGKQELSGSPCECADPHWEVIASAPTQLRAFQTW